VDETPPPDPQEALHDLHSKEQQGACEVHVASKMARGWVVPPLVPDRCGDGGFPDSALEQLVLEATSDGQ
jgi:hypothetical protein